MRKEMVAPQVEIEADVQKIKVQVIMQLLQWEQDITGCYETRGMNNDENQHCHERKIAGDRLCVKECWRLHHCVDQNEGVRYQERNKRRFMEMICTRILQELIMLDKVRVIVECHTLGKRINGSQCCQEVVSCGGAL